MCVCEQGSGLSLNGQPADPVDSSSMSFDELQQRLATGSNHRLKSPLDPFDKLFFWGFFLFHHMVQTQVTVMGAAGADLHHGKKQHS